MIDFTNALELAKKIYSEKNITDILEAYDADGVWIIFGGKKGLTQIGGSGIAIDKTTGAVEDFILPSAKNFDLLNKAKEIDLSEQQNGMSPKVKCLP